MFVSLHFLPGPYPMYRLLPVSEFNHPLAHQTKNLLAGIAMATRQDEDGDTYVNILSVFWVQN